MSLERRRWLVSAPPHVRKAVLRDLARSEALSVESDWITWARDEQLAPAHPWRTWLVCAGRGFGKTRTGAEWINGLARTQPQARIALVGASIGEARAVMVEGESGVLACSTARDRPQFEASLRRLTWPSGAQAWLYSAGEPESLRGPQHSHAWCDEIGKWDNASSRATNAWDNLLLGLRLGQLPQVLATTTPRAVPLIQRLFAEAEGDPATIITRGTTFDNKANLTAGFLAAMKRQFGNTTLGRQELEGELLTDVDGALWSRSLLEACRVPMLAEDLVRTVIGVDPPASARGDECGIVVCARTESGRGLVLDDCSVKGASPEGWARAVAAAMDRWQADRVVAEANQGGDMVASVLRAADCQMPVKLVHASRGKVARAEPVAALYEAGRISHLGMFARLEDQLCGLMTGGEYHGPGRSPDRADALVWALSELLLGKRSGPPRVRGV